MTREAVVQVLTALGIKPVVWLCCFELPNHAKLMPDYEQRPTCRTQWTLALRTERNVLGLGSKVALRRALVRFLAGPCPPARPRYVLIAARRVSRGAAAYSWLYRRKRHGS